MVVSVPTVVSHIGDRMQSHLVNSLAFFYRLLMKMYPPAYRAEFADEMSDTFKEGVDDAASQGMLGTFLWRELRDTPEMLVRVYSDEWMTKLQTGFQTLQHAASTSDLPPAPPDGRESWRQAFWELSLFATAAALLVIPAYLSFVEMRAGWQRDAEFLGKVIVPLTLPVVLLGLARGLPRWAYPFGGLLLGYEIFISYQSSMWLFLIAMLFACSVLAAAAILTDPQPSRLPIPVRRVGQSLAMDWTRLSFGIYGAMPLIVLMAFDDAHANDRTVYLALSVLGMLVSVFIYCRSRATSTQITALLMGLTFTIWCAWMDKITFADGLVSWVMVPSMGLEEMSWLLKLWLQWGVLILSPALFVTIGRAARMKRAI